MSLAWVAEIISGLSRVKWLFVISRHSTFIYKGRPIDVKSVGRELGVRYVLEGSVRRSGDQVRVRAVSSSVSWNGTTKRRSRPSTVR